MQRDAFPRLVAVAACLRHADSLMLAAVPLVGAAVFKLPADQVGAMVAAQGAAWLIVSLPAGLMVDRIAPLLGMTQALAVSVLGFAVALFGYAANSAPLFSFGSFLTASAVVIGYLAEGASVQRLRAGAGLGQANARLQIVQASAMIVGPAAMGLAVGRGEASTGLAAAAALAVAGLIIARGFPDQPAPPQRARAPWAEIREGFAFVRAEPLLRGIVACALFWNAAFMALAAVIAPYALGSLAMNAGEIGAAQAAMGVGSLLAALGSGLAMARLPPRVLLAFGPASSALAALLLRFAPASDGFAALALAYLTLGFGPILWFVCQNTIRQLVTPQGLLGRVGAVIQLAIYGVRSLGALAGGVTAARWGGEAALTLVVALFALSALVIPLSALGRLRSMPHAAGSQA